MPWVLWMKELSRSRGSVTRFNPPIQDVALAAEKSPSQCFPATQGGWFGLLGQWAEVGLAFIWTLCRWDTSEVDESVCMWEHLQASLLSTEKQVSGPCMELKLSFEQV